MNVFKWRWNEAKKSELSWRHLSEFQVDGRTIVRKCSAAVCKSESRKIELTGLGRAHTCAGVHELQIRNCFRVYRLWTITLCMFHQLPLTHLGLHAATRIEAVFMHMHAYYWADTLSCNYNMLALQNFYEIWTEHLYLTLSRQKWLGLPI